MSRYSVDPQGVSGVLSAVQLSGQSLGTAFGKIQPAQEELNSGVGALLSSVANASISLLESEAARVQGIGDRVVACVSGAALATTAYVEGDETMFIDTQAKATTAAAGGNASFFEGDA